MSTEINDGNLVETEGFEIGLDSGPELLGPLRGMPMALIVSCRTNLRHNYQIVRIGIKRLQHQLIGDVGSVELRRVDVVHPCVYRTTKYSQRNVSILRRTEHIRTGKLHCTKTHAADKSAA